MNLGQIVTCTLYIVKSLASWASEFHDLFNKHFNDVTLQLFRSSLSVDHTLLFNLCNSRIETDLVVSHAHTVQYAKLHRSNTCKKKHPSSWLITNYNPPTRQPSGKFYFSNTVQEDHLRKQQPSIQNGTNSLKKSVIRVHQVFVEYRLQVYIIPDTISCLMKSNQSLITTIVQHVVVFTRKWPSTLVITKLTRSSLTFRNP